MSVNPTRKCYEQKVLIEDPGVNKYCLYIYIYNIIVYTLYIYTHSMRVRDLDIDSLLFR